MPSGNANYFQFRRATHAASVSGRSVSLSSVLCNGCMYVTLENRRKSRRGRLNRSSNLTFAVRDSLRNPRIFRLTFRPRSNRASSRARPSVASQGTAELGDLRTRSAFQDVPLPHLYSAGKRPDFRHAECKLFCLVFL